MHFVPLETQGKPTLMAGQVSGLASGQQPQLGQGGGTREAAGIKDSETEGRDGGGK